MTEEEKQQERTTAAAATTTTTKMKMGISYDERMELHASIYSRHPEKPGRTRAVWKALNDHGLVSRCHFVTAREATADEIALTHSIDYVRRVFVLEEALSPPYSQQHQQQQRFSSTTITAASDGVDGDGGMNKEENKEVVVALPEIVMLRSDTYANVHTPQAARLAVGACIGLVDAIANNTIHNGVAVVRPPGHHADRTTSMGFCLFNNAACAAKCARTQHPTMFKRVLVVDFDVHHGNGTESLFAGDESLMYASIHRGDRGKFYPMTGNATSTGTNGHAVNVAWPESGVGDEDYMEAMKQVIVPIAKEFDPSLVILSAGFDAAEGDPLGKMKVSLGCFAQMTKEVMSIAPDGKLLMVLEGGYNEANLSAGMVNCVKALLGDDVVVEEGVQQSSSSTTGDPQQHQHQHQETLDEVISIQSKFWTCMKTKTLPSTTHSDEINPPSQSSSTSSITSTTQ